MLAPCTDKKIRVIGSKASIEWWDEQPNQLRYEVQGKTRTDFRTRNGLSVS
ncbi:hypothetical protein GCM10020331_084620 [Ectobacillus funiculus]